MSSYEEILPRPISPNLVKDIFFSAFAPYQTRTTDLIVYETMPEGQGGCLVDLYNREDELGDEFAAEYPLGVLTWSDGSIISVVNWTYSEDPLPIYRDMWHEDPMAPILVFANPYRGYVRCFNYPSVDEVDLEATFHAVVSEIISKTTPLYYRLVALRVKQEEVESNSPGVDELKCFSYGGLQKWFFLSLLSRAQQCATMPEQMAN
ncbi:hypothetical protein EMCG_01250 [[Emmonsia] crescens]|uniref:Uncharacterized protein n=1 Tax=[Emmonsia] crescens TaxID=73230 RepID=A0A0G2I5G2_9EURO|nr:hypothetical protein EMCG_01250 [Emmonsia crescens UAMH 3008]